MLCLVSVKSNFLRPHGLQPFRFLCPWDYPGQNTGMGYHPFSRGSSYPRDWTQVSCIAVVSLPPEPTGKYSFILGHIDSTGLYGLMFSSVQCSAVSDSETPWAAARQASLSITNSQSLLKTHVPWVSDAIQTSHPLLSPSPLAFNLLQHQALFKWVSSLHQVAKVLELQLQHQSLRLMFGTDFL